MEEHLERYKGKKLVFLFDTNVYRSIAKMTKDGRIIGNRFIIDEMNRREADNNYKSIMSLTASQELLNHLHKDEDKRIYEECNNALRFQFFHTQILQLPATVPLIDSLLTLFFFNTDTKDNRLGVSRYIFTLLNKIFSQNVEMSFLQKDIEAIRNDFLSDKRVFYNLFNLFLKRPDNIQDDGTYKKGNYKLHESLNRNEHVSYMRDFLIKRAKYQFSDNLDEEIVESKVIEFDFYFKEAFLQFRYLFEVLRDNPNKLELLEYNNIWNSIMDFHIVFEWCYLKYNHRGGDIEAVLITDDKKNNNKNLSSYKNGEGRNPDVWPLVAYFEFLGFIVEGTDIKDYKIHFKNTYSSKKVCSTSE